MIVRPSILDVGAGGRDSKDFLFFEGSYMSWFDVILVVSEKISRSLLLGLILHIMIQLPNNLL